MYFTFYWILSSFLTRSLFTLHELPGEQLRESPCAPSKEPSPAASPPLPSARDWQHESPSSSLRRTCCNRREHAWPSQACHHQRYHRSSSRSLRDRIETVIFLKTIEELLDSLNAILIELTNDECLQVIEQLLLGSDDSGIDSGNDSRVRGHLRGGVGSR